MDYNVGVGPLQVEGEIEGVASQVVFDAMVEAYKNAQTPDTDYDDGRDGDLWSELVGNEAEQ